MTALHTPAKKGVSGLSHHLPLTAAVLPAFQNSITKVGAVLGSALAFKAGTHSDESREIFVVPGAVTSCWAGLAELIDSSITSSFCLLLAVSAPCDAAFRVMASPEPKRLAICWIRGGAAAAPDSDHS